MTMMKTKLSILLSVLVGGGCLLSAGALEIGDTLQQALDELGRPDGYVKVGDSRVLYYPRGRVEVADGKVVVADLVTAEEAEARRIREAEEQANRQEELRQLREQRYVDGKAALEAKMADAAFQQASSSKRIAYWETFKRSYPEVPLPEDYYVALRERDLERREQRAAVRLDALEERAQAAEARASEAEERAYDTERRYRYSRYDYGSTYPRYDVPYATYNVYNDGSRRTTVRKDRIERDDSPIVVRRYIGSSIPQATYRPYDSTAGYGFQRSTGSSMRTSTTRQGPIRASDGVNADVHISF